MQSTPERLVFRQPAVRWTDALPTGNGTVGAMMYGSICDDRILLNHEAVYRPAARAETPDLAGLLPRLRNLLLEGRYSEAAGLYPGAGDHMTRRPSPYQPVCTLRIRTKTSRPFERYRRGIDLSNGLVWAEWRDAGVIYRRELFVSRTEGLVFLRMRADTKGAISTEVELARPDYEPETENLRRMPEGDAPSSADYRFEGEAPWCRCLGRFQDGYEFGAVARTSATGDADIITNSSTAGSVIVSGADEVLVTLGLYANGEGNKQAGQIALTIESTQKDFELLLERHGETHGGIYARTSLSVGDATSCNDPAPPVEDMLADAYDGRVSNALILSMFAFGRHLAVCSNGVGGWPANLQGIWNGAYSPPWESDFHNDENIQMNYWAVLPGMMHELMIPLFDYYERHLPEYRENAGKLYGTRGILLPIAQTLSGGMYPGIWSYWISAAGWIAQHFYDYYLYTSDEEFLRLRAVPWLLETAEFYEDFLIETDEGKLIFYPSLSPENTPSIEGGELVTINATMDVAICREVLTNLCSACELLGAHADRVPKWQSILSRLPGYEINEDGAMREWLYPGLPDNYHHRHQSHVYPVFPGFSITEETEPEIYEACRIAIEKRLVIGLTSQTGWSLAHMANVYARLGEGDRAIECLGLITRACTGRNLLTYHNDNRAMGLTLGGLRADPKFQIDANFGYTAAVLEMLVFSRPGLIKLLPALPDRWSSGRAGKIACRGGITVELSWDLDGGTMEAVITAKKSGSVTVKFPRKLVDIQSENDGVQVTENPAYGSLYRDVTLPAGVPVILRARFV